MPDTFTGSLWFATAPPGPDLPRLAGERRCDVAVVGAGILGLSLALALAETGADVVVLEAREPGFGASGRNGGLVVPSFARNDPESVRRHLGPERGDRLSRLVGGSAAAVFALIRRLGIPCEAVQSGWLNPAHAPSRVAALARRHALWSALGQACEWLDRAAACERIGSAAFHAAYRDPSGGHLNPLAYVRGLARAALAAGAAVHGLSPVRAILRQGTVWRLDAAEGRVLAPQVFCCVNAMAGGLLPAVAAGLVPLTVYQMATGPVPAARRRVLPLGDSLSDTRHNLFACRWTAGDRMVTGGMATIRAGAMGRLKGRLARRLTALLPGLGPTRMDQAWSGSAALTPDFLPRLHALGPGLYAPIACNGRGLALATALGPVLADFAAGRLAERDLPVPLSAPRPLALPVLARQLPALLLPLGSWADRRP